jgi:hypothetical protein
VGHCLWDFIDGIETIRLYQAILQRVRAAAAQIVAPFRCDSPTLRRYMRLEISCQPQDSVQFDGLLVLVEPTSSRLNPLDLRFPRSHDVLNVCIPQTVEIVRISPYPARYRTNQPVQGIAAASGRWWNLLAGWKSRISPCDCIFWNKNGPRKCVMRFAPTVDRFACRSLMNPKGNNVVTIRFTSGRAPASEYPQVVQCDTDSANVGVHATGKLNIRITFRRWAAAYV